MRADIKRSSEQIVAAESELMRGFLAEELLGTDISGDYAKGIYYTADVMAIAAEDLAQTMARAHGDIDPESPNFLSELIINRINREDSKPPFVFDFDTEFRGIDIVDEGAVNVLVLRAKEIAETLVAEARMAESLTGMFSLVET